MPHLIAKIVFGEPWPLPLSLFPKKPPRPLRLDEIPPLPARHPDIKRLDEI